MATTIPVTTEAQEFRTLPLDSVKESPYNARRLYNQEALQSLADSIIANGIAQPLLTRPVNGHYEIVAGFKARRAAELAGLTEVPVIIRDMTDKQAREINLIENIQREDVHPMHEALGMRDALSVGGYDVARLASRLGKHERHIHKRLQLCRLIEPLQQAFLDGWFSLGAITECSKLTEEQQTAAHGEFFKPGKQRQYTVSERDVTGWISYNVLVVLKKAIFDLKDAELVPAAGACVGCLKRTGAAPMLWENTEEDQCTDPACYKGKVEAFMNQKREKLTKKHGAEGFVQVSTYYRRSARPEETTKILGSESYETVKKGDCEFAKPGLNVEGDLGKVIWICANQLCPVHGKGTTSTDPDRIKQKAAEKESAVRGRVFQMILKQYPAETTRELREFVAVKFANRLSHDVDITLAKLLKVDTGKGEGINYIGYVKKLSDRELEIFMLALALADEAKVMSYQSHDRKGPLFDIAEKFNVPVAQASSYCDAWFHARTKRGKEREQAMRDLPIDPVSITPEITAEEAPKPVEIKKVSKKARKSA